MAVGPQGQIALMGLAGRASGVPPLAVPEHLAEEARNVDWWRSSLARKRRGSVAISLAGGTAQTGRIVTLVSHLPGSDPGALELWALDDAATPRWKRLTGGTTWADVTVVDAVASAPHLVDAASFNGKLFLAFDSAVNRLHVWDPVDGQVRRVGLPQPDPPAAANSGSGTYPATIRYYKVAWTVQRSGATIRRSELSAATSFTPSGAGAGVQVTRPSLDANEFITHWEIYGSPDDNLYFLLTTLPVATTTYVDSADPASYDGDSPPDVGTNVPPPSAKYLVADGNRLVMAGAWETSGGGTTPVAHRVWWTAPLGASDVGDDERVTQTLEIKNYHDLEEAPTGLSPSFNGAIYVFSELGMWKMVATGTAEAAYVVFRIAGGVGCIAHRSIVSAVDAAGNPALYWLSSRGPYRLGAGGQEFLGDPITDVWETVNFSATVVAHGLYHRDRNQIWWWIATSGSSYPNLKLVLDITKSAQPGGGWAIHDGPSAEAASSALFARTPGTTMSRELAPYVGRSSGTAIWRTDEEGATTDAGTAYRAYVRGRAAIPWGLGQFGGGRLGGAIVVAEAQAGVTLQVSAVLDLGRETRSGTGTIAGVGGQSRAFVKIEDFTFAQAQAVQIEVGDPSAQAALWNLDAVLVETLTEGSR